MIIPVEGGSEQRKEAMNNYTIHFYSHQIDSNGHPLNVSADVQASNPAGAARIGLEQVKSLYGSNPTGIRNIMMQDPESTTMLPVGTNVGAIWAAIQRSVASV